MDGTRAFPYTSLDTTIRLLKIRRSPDGTRIIGLLESFCLDSPNCPDFLTLSYVWGSPTHPQSILLNDQPFAIWQNLYAFFKLVSEGGEFSSNAWWWVDAICINQKDLGERSSQVKLMGRIYEQSEKTIVWLGEESENSGEAIASLHLLRDKRWELGDRDRNQFRPLRDPKSGVNWIAIENLLQRPWWRRVWTLQEFIISQHIVFYCGRARIERHNMQSAIYGLWLCGGADGKLLSKRAFEGAWNRRRLLQWYTKLHQMPLVAMIAYLGDSQATDDRDRIYALLGLAGDCAIAGQPDYSSDVEEVYTRLAQEFITKYKSLDIICFAHIYNHDARKSDLRSGLPSWVPDWRADVVNNVTPLMASQAARDYIGSFRPLSALDFHAVYEASGKLEANVTYSPGLLVMNCKGIMIDYIDGLGGLDGNIQRLGSDKEGESGNALIVSSSSENLPTGQTDELKEEKPAKGVDPSDLMDVITRCLVLDRQDRYFNDPAPIMRFRAELEALYQRATQESTTPASRHFTEWFENNKMIYINGYSLDSILETATETSNPAPSLDDGAFLTRFRETTQAMARRLAVTDRGYLGMAPARARKGDAICVLFGCNIPVVLRSREGKESYEFIGECYVDGFMNGEILKHEEQGKRERQIFQLE